MNSLKPVPRERPSQYLGISKPKKDCQGGVSGSQSCPWEPQATPQTALIKINSGEPVCWPPTRVDFGCNLCRGVESRPPMAFVPGVAGTPRDNRSPTCLASSGPGGRQCVLQSRSPPASPPRAVPIWTSLTHPGWVAGVGGHLRGRRCRRRAGPFLQSRRGVASAQVKPTPTYPGNFGGGD